MNRGSWWPRTWPGLSPQGKTPVFYHLYKKGRISAISFLAVSLKKRRLALLRKIWEYGPMVEIHLSGKLEKHREIIVYDRRLRPRELLCREFD
jgi:hypothetical protein